MTNELERLSQPPKQDGPIIHDLDADLAEEARLSADFLRLCQQYRRAGYEYYQRRSVLCPDSVSQPLSML